MWGLGVGSPRFASRLIIRYVADVIDAEVGRWLLRGGNATIVMEGGLESPADA